VSDRNAQRIRADDANEADGADWHRRVVGRSLHDAKRRSIDRGARFVRAAANVLERTNGALTVQEVADEAGQSLRTLYQYFESKDDLLLAVFEEAMHTYARIVRNAIANLDEPVERLAGGIIAAVRVAALHDKAGVDRGLSSLRLQLTQAQPDLVARSQEPVTSLYRELVDAAVATAQPGGITAEHATYFVASLRSSVMLSVTLGNDLSVDVPGAIDLSCFCLGGLGLERPRAWHEDVDKRLHLTGSDGRSVLRRLAKAPARG
jgi:AcrR family transcriptional regulator